MRGALLIPALLLAGCSISALPSSPLAVASRTTLDERAALQAEELYIAAGTVILAADRYGLVPAASRKAIGVAQRRAFLAVRAVRAAYDAGNAGEYAASAERARAATRLLLEAFKR